MRIDDLLKECIKHIIDEAFENRSDIFRISKQEADEEERRAVKMEKPKLHGFKNYSDAVTANSENSIEELMSLPEYQTVEDFASFAYDDERQTFSTDELQAITRNVFGVEHPGVSQIKQVRGDLEGYGFTFVPRENVKGTRGVSSNAHGTHPFAGTGAGGTGFSSGGLGLGTGPGAIGSKTAWDASSSKNLPMGSRRR